MKVEFTASAKLDLQDLRRYVRQFKPPGTWQIVKEQLRKQVSHLSQFPDAGAIPDELTGYSAGYRQVMNNQERLIYRVTGDTLYVHVICAQVQDLQEDLLKRLTRP